MEIQSSWLTVVRAPGLGGSKLIALLEAAGGIEALAGASPSGLRELGVSTEAAEWIRRPDEARIAADLEWLGYPGRHLLTWDSERYPALLKRIPAPPAALFVEGDPDALWQPAVAIIGSRNPTSGGLEHARAFSAELSRQGMTVTSGLASGIDCAAHEAAMRAGGLTIAVTGTGLDRVYPESSRATAEKITSHGALVSEFPPGTPPRRGHFPARNRIISGLSLGVLVVEAGLNSGSLITARHATEQGREVFALPGSLHNPMVKGCHRLIREGARLVETCGDIMQELGPMAAELAMELRSRLEAGDDPLPVMPEKKEDVLADPEYFALWQVLGFDPVPIDRLATQSGMKVQAISSMLLVMELEGMVEAIPGGRYCRRG